MRNNIFVKKTWGLVFFCTILALSSAVTQTATTNQMSPQPNQKANTEKQRLLPKDWNLIVYIASNNNLNKFARVNANQMMQVGSTSNINILVQCDTYKKREISRYYIEKNNAILLDKQTNTHLSTSGTPENLYDFAQWSIKNFPANHHAIILWNHGSGIEDPSMWGRNYHWTQLLTKNPKTGLLETSYKLQKQKGIAFNDFFHEYLTNQDLKQSLAKISKELLGGKKIDIVGMDACNMAMLEVGSQIKDHVSYMVASEETEPGTGWNYSFVLSPFLYKTLTPKEFCVQIVQAYKQEYLHSHSDFTQSAISLNNYSSLESNINNVAQSLLQLIKGSDKYKIIRLLKKIRNSAYLTTMFAQKSYIDMHHFYQSLLQKIQIQRPLFVNKKQITILKKLLSDGKAIITEQVIDNVVSSYTPNAKGISLYFPTKQIHSSYLKTDFAQTNYWVLFLDEYIKNSRSS